MILGITPARGGSSIHQKNIKPIYGKPLIAWTIEAAKKSTLLDSYIVSTENKEIAKIVTNLGAEVLERPLHLATDTAKTVDVLKHVLEKIPADIIVLLQCTSPVRSDGLIDACVQKFIDTKADSLATGYICKLLEWGTYNKRRQDLNGWFHDDGNIYVMRADLILKNKLWGDKMEKFIVPHDHRLEIDDDFDFWVNEQILKKLYENNG